MIPIIIVVIFILGGIFLASFIGHCRHKHTPNKTPPIFVSRRERYDR